MASVYKAYHASLDRSVAIKVMHPGFKEDKTFTSRFQREARVLARLDHPNIIPIYDFAEQDGQPYLVMKYVEGETLKDQLQHGRLTLPETVSLVEAVGAALAYAHQQGVLHRDIKPSNIILTPDNHIYLSDFGLARIASAGESSISQDTLLGTPNYMSPEQAKGQTDLDARTDLYSLGVVLYELIVGQLPFSGDTPYAIVHDHIYTPLPRPSTVNAEVGGPMEAFLVKALAKDRQDRYPDVPSFVAAFKQAAQASAAKAASVANRTEAWPPATVVTPKRVETVQADAPGPAPARPQPTNKLNWWVAGLGLLLVVCLGVIGLAALNRLGRDNRAKATASAEAALTVPAVATIAPTPSIPATVAPATATSASDTGLATAQAAATTSPNSVAANVQLGRAYYLAGQFDLATQAYERAAQLSQYRPLFYTVNVVGQYRDDPVFGLTLLSDGLQHNNNARMQLELWTMAAPFLEAASPLPEAQPVLLSLAQSFPNQPAAVLALAQNYVLQNQLDKAQPVIDDARQKFPDLPLTHYVYAEYLEAQGDTAQAEAEYQSVIANSRTSQALKQTAQKSLDKLKGTPNP